MSDANDIIDGRVAADKRDEFTIALRFTSEHPGGEWLICSSGTIECDDPIWRCDHAPSDSEIRDGQPPERVRQEYERIIGYDPSGHNQAMVNFVEMMVGEEDCAFDQKCIYGRRVESHAVYCHNPWWLYAPRKCRRCADFPHKECAGFELNIRENVEDDMT